MLNIIYGDINEYNELHGTDYETIYGITDWFELRCRPHWLNNSFAKRVIKEVDKSIHEKDYVVYSPAFGYAIPHLWLSGGAKTLIILNSDKREDGKPLMILGSHMGDNCTDCLADLSLEKDIWINLKHFLCFNKGRDVKAKIINLDKEYTNTTDLNEVIIDIKVDFTKYMVDKYGMFC